MRVISRGKNLRFVLVRCILISLLGMMSWQAYANAFDEPMADSRAVSVVDSTESDSLISCSVVTTQTSEKYTKSGWEFESRVSFTYDELLRIKHAQFVNSPNGTYQEFSIAYTYMPDGRGSRSEALYRTERSGKWIPFIHSEMECDEMGHVIKSQTIELQDSNRTEGRRFDRSFDAEGRLTSRTADFFKGGKWGLVARVCYSPVGGDTLEDRTEEKWTGGEWSPEGRMITRVNTLGDQQQALIIGLSVARPLEAYTNRVITTNNPTKHQRIETRELFLVDQWVPDSREVYTTNLSPDSAFCVRQIRTTRDTSWNTESREITTFRIVRLHPPAAIAGSDGNSGGFELRDPFPNPLNPRTTIGFLVPRTSFVSVKVYDIFGREVRTLSSGMREAGEHNVRWEGGDQRTGVYFIRLTSGQNTCVKQVHLISD